MAVKRGWPQVIDFEKLPKRISRMKLELEAIIRDKGEHLMAGDEIDDDDDDERSPRSRSLFWREVEKEVKKQGSRTVAGVKGQFATFEKTQPG